MFTIVRCLKAANNTAQAATAAAASLLLLGCSTGPEHLSARQFQRRYAASQTQMMQQYSYAAETNGFVYISRLQLPRFYYSKLKRQTLFTETNGLPPVFLKDLRSQQALESSR